MQNEIARRSEKLLTQAEDAADGCHLHEVSIGIQLNKETFVRAAFTLLLNKDGAFQAARTGKLNAVTAQRTADTEAKAFLTLFRDRMKKIFGSTWSQMWSEVGFTSGKLSMPATMAERQALCLKNKTFLEAHPEYAVEDLDLTAEEAQARYAALSAARSTVNACTADVAVKKVQRNNAARDLRKCLRGLIT